MNTFLSPWQNMIFLNPRVGCAGCAGVLFGGAGVLFGGAGVVLFGGADFVRYIPEKSAPILFLPLAVAPI